MSGRRILAYDALRSFAILSVVAIHTLMPYRDLAEPTAPVRVLDDLLHYAVPLFVFISGVFVWARPLRDEPGSYRRFIAARFSLIGLPYLAWSAVFLALLTAGSPQSLPRVLGLLLTGHTWYHLYFIPMLLTFYLLTPVATRITRVVPELLLVLAYALRIHYGPDILHFAETTGGDLARAYATHIVTHLPHMALGAWFVVRLDRIPRTARLAWPVLLSAGTAIMLGASLGWWSGLTGYGVRFVYPAGMALTLLGMALGTLQAEPALERSARVRRWVLASAALAFGVYFVHPLPLLALDTALESLGLERLWSYPLFPVAVFLAVTVLSLAASALLARSPWSAWLVGARVSRR